MDLADEFLIILALGDSLTAGYRTLDPYATDRSVPYPAQLEALLRSRLKGQLQAFVINAGVNGDNTEGMLFRFRRLVAIEKPEIVIIWGGINDLGAAEDPEQIIENLTVIYNMCIENGVKPVACTLTPTRLTSPKIKRLNELIRMRVSEKSIAIADLFLGLVDKAGNLKKEYSDDGFHLNVTGYGKVAYIVFNALTPLILKRR